MNILLTRPLAQNDALTSLLKNCAQQPILFPTLEIKKLNAEPLQADYDAVIFISVNAVEYGLQIFKRIQTVQVFAVGAATAARLKHYGIKVSAFVRHNPSSEALLSMDKVRQILNQTVLIFRGRGGRETLKTGLLKQNNTVEYIEVYQRLPRQISCFLQNSMTQFFRRDEGIIVITSIEGLTAMMTLIKQINPDFIAKIKHYHMVVLSARIGLYAQEIGFKKIHISAQIDDNGIVKAINDLTNK